MRNTQGDETAARETAMTNLSLMASDGNVLQLRRYRVLVPREQRAATTVFSAALGLSANVIRAWQKTAAARAGRRQLIQLDERLLRDIGLTRTDVHFGDLDTLSRRSRAGGI
jgi:uncharacterized protein YjiS (DUF1127 family)